MYKRYIFIIIDIVLIVYLTINKEKYDIILTTYNIKFPVVYILWPILILIVYLGINTYKQKENLEDDYEHYEHKRKFNMLFWIVAVLQIYMVWWLLIIKSNLIMIEDGIIWEIVRIKLVYYYDFAQQRDFFYKHLTMIMENIIQLPIEEQNNIRLFIDELNIENIFTKNTTIIDIKVFTEEFLTDYVTLLNDKKMRAWIATYFVENTAIYPIMVLIRNLLFLAVMIKFVSYKLPFILVITLFKPNLILVIRDDLLKQNVDFNMTELEILDFCLLLSLKMIKRYHPLNMLMEIIKAKFGL